MTTYHAIMTNVANASAYNARIEGVLDTFVSDWLRTGAAQYIVAGDKTAFQIYQAVRPQLPANAHILVIEVNINHRHGYMSKLAIDWIKRHAP